MWQSEATSTTPKAPRRLSRRKCTRGQCSRSTVIGWIVVDHLLGPSGTDARAETFWHMHPDWSLTSSMGDRCCFAIGTRRHQAVASTSPLYALNPSEAHGLDSYAPVYGRTERGLCVGARIQAHAQRSSAAFIPAGRVFRGVCH